MEKNQDRSMKGPYRKSQHLQHDPEETLDHVLRSSSFSSLESFKNHLSRAFGLGHISEDSIVLPTQEDKSSIASCERVSPESVIQDYREQNFEDDDTPSHLKPESSSVSPIHKTNNGTLKRLSSFIEMKSWWKEEVICKCDEEDMEFNYLDEDSPLKGKGKVLWRKREPELDSWKAKSMFPSIATQINPLKRRQVQRGSYSERRNYQKRK
jgi:hypothetical protein